MQPTAHATAPPPAGLFAHKATFMGLSSRVKIAMVKEAFALKLREENRGNTFRAFGTWLGLSFDISWCVIVLILFAYATSAHEMKSWAIIVPPWSPLFWTLVMYLFFVTGGPHSSYAVTGAVEYDAASFKKTPFIVSLVVYFAGFVITWGIISCAISVDTAANVVVVAADRSVEVPDSGSWWGVVALVFAVLNILIGCVTTFVGLKHFLGRDPDRGMGGPAIAAPSGGSPMSSPARGDVGVVVDASAIQMEETTGILSQQPPPTGVARAVATTVSAGPAPSMDYSGFYSSASKELTAGGPPPLPQEGSTAI
eukprot:SAG31_NODE_1325_length_8781_cov_5.940221_8_plen_311_part_00